MRFEFERTPLNSRFVHTQDKKAIEVGEEVEIIFDEIVFQGEDICLMNNGECVGVLETSKLPLAFVRKLYRLDGLIVSEKPELIGGERT